MRTTGLERAELVEQLQQDLQEHIVDLLDTETTKRMARSCTAWLCGVPEGYVDVTGARLDEQRTLHITARVYLPVKTSEVSFSVALS